MQVTNSKEERRKWNRGLNEEEKIHRAMWQAQTVWVMASTNRFQLLKHERTSYPTLPSFFLLSLPFASLYRYVFPLSFNRWDAYNNERAIINGIIIIDRSTAFAFPLLLHPLFCLSFATFLSFLFPYRRYRINAYVERKQANGHAHTAWQKEFNHEIIATA